MRGLMRVVVALVALSALVGCSAMEEQTKAPPSGCAEWVDDREGGYCGKTEAEAQREYYDSLNHSRSSGGESGSSFSQSSDPSETDSSDQSPVYRGSDLDCENFGSRAEAQAYLEAHPADADYLDGDGDGVACEWGT